MTVKDKLLVEFECAIIAVFGDKALEEISEDNQISNEDLEIIKKKVEFYLGLR